MLAKATVHKNLGCGTLGGVTSQIDSIVSVDTENLSIDMKSLSTSELYAAYRLYKEADSFGAKSPPSEKLNDLLAEKANDDWLKNFKPEKWTYKENRIEKFEEETIEKVIVHELDIPML